MDSLMDERKEFFRQLGLPRHEVYEWAKRSFEIPNFDMKFYRDRRHELRTQRISQAKVDERILEEIKELFRNVISLGKQCQESQERNHSITNLRHLNRSRERSRDHSIAQSRHSYRSGERSRDHSVAHSRHSNRSRERSRDHSIAHPRHSNRSPDQLRDHSVTGSRHSNSHSRRSNLSPHEDRSQDRLIEKSQRSNRSRSIRSGNSRVRDQSLSPPPPPPMVQNWQIDDVRIESPINFGRHNRTRSRSPLQHRFNEDNFNKTKDIFRRRSPLRSESVSEDFQPQLGNNEIKNLFENRGINPGNRASKWDEYRVGNEEHKTTRTGNEMDQRHLHDERNQDTDQWNRNRHLEERIDNERDFRRLSRGEDQVPNQRDVNRLGNQQLSFDRFNREQLSGNQQSDHWNRNREENQHRGVNRFGSERSQRNDDHKSNQSDFNRFNNEGNQVRGNQQAGFDRFNNERNQFSEDQHSGTSRSGNERNSFSGNKQPGFSRFDNERNQFHGKDSSDSWVGNRGDNVQLGQNRFDNITSQHSNISHKNNESDFQNLNRGGIQQSSIIGFGLERNQRMENERQNEQSTLNRFGNDRNQWTEYRDGNQQDNNMPRNNLNSNQTQQGNWRQETSMDFRRESQMELTRSKERLLQQSQTVQRPNEPFGYLTDRDFNNAQKNDKQQSFINSTRAYNRTQDNYPKTNESFKLKTSTITTSHQDGGGSNNFSRTSNQQSSFPNNQNPFSRSHNQNIQDDGPSTSQSSTKRNIEEKREYRQQVKEGAIKKQIAPYLGKFTKRNRLRAQICGELVPGYKVPKTRPRSFWENWWKTYGMVEEKALKVDKKDEEVLKVIEVLKTTNIRTKKDAEDITNYIQLCERAILNSINASAKENRTVDAYDFLKAQLITHLPLKVRSSNPMTYAAQKSLRNITNLISRVEISNYFFAIIDTWKQAFDALCTPNHPHKLQAVNLMRDKVFNWIVHLAIQEIKHISSPIMNPPTRGEELRTLYEQVGRCEISQTDSLYSQFFATPKCLNKISAEEFVQNKIDEIKLFIDTEHGETLDYYMAFKIMKSIIILNDKTWDTQISIKLKEQKNFYLNNLDIYPNIDMLYNFMLDKYLSVFNRRNYLMSMNYGFKTKTLILEQKSLRPFLRRGDMQYICRWILEDRLKKFQNFEGIEDYKCLEDYEKVEHVKKNKRVNDDGDEDDFKQRTDGRDSVGDYLRKYDYDDKEDYVNRDFQNYDDNVMKDDYFAGEL